MKTCLMLSLFLFAVPARGESDPNLLLHWGFDQGGGAVAKDSSGNQLDGTLSAGRVGSPKGLAAMMDGSPKSLLSVTLPEGKRFGKDSWTFMTMLKPERFEIDDQQNQRRLFDYGKYPSGYLGIDINGAGRTSWYFCYQLEGQKTVATGGSTTVALEKGAWAHLALVCDREARRVDLFINGFPAGHTEIPAHFDGEFSGHGRLTVGSSWHNYWGLVDEVKIHRSALSSAAVEEEYERLKGAFGVVESEAVRGAKLLARLERGFAGASAAWARKDFAEVRRLCGEVVAVSEVPAHFRSYARLRIAQSHVAEGDLWKAKAVYADLAGRVDTPKVHRDEARELIAELDRQSREGPARDPAASRTALPKVGKFAAEVFVGVDGVDTNSGTEDRPFANLQRARKEVRSLKKTVRGPIAVTILPGEYPVGGTLALTTEDSGSAEAPIVYRAKEKGTVTFYGGRRLEGFQPVTDAGILKRLPESAQGKVWQCDLKALGINDFGKLKVRGFGQSPSPPTLEVFVDRVPMTLSRWPNEGFVGIGKLIKPGTKETGEPSVFEYLSDRHERWIEATDAWLFGYFHWLWADATIKVGKIDPASKTLTTAAPYHYGGGMNTVQGIQYHAFNLLEEIDMPGEWYLERETGVLYLYPPSDLGKAVVEIGMLSKPMVTMSGVSHVRWERVGFDLARFNCMELKDCEECWVLGCEVGRMAGNGVMIHGGHRNTMIGCDIHTIGRRASEVIGGDRATLVPGEHLVENCRIHDFGRIDRTYTPAIQLEGVGNRVAHNLMYDGPSSAMRIEGNDHLIEFNEVHSMVRESDDQGAMEIYGNPTYRGVVFRHNHLHHIGQSGVAASVHGQAAIRFDDAISGMLVYGNVFYQAANGKFGAVQMNSGRDNLMDNNLFIDCKQGISGGWYPGNNVWKRLRAGENLRGFYRTGLYLERYPQIITMMDAPGINHLWRNVFHRCGRVATRTENIDQFQNAVFEDRDPGFVDAGNGDFRLRPDAKVLQTTGFRPIPFDEIGLYESPARASWPVETTPVEMPDWREAAGH